MDATPLYILSVVSLVLGLVGYALGHPCSAPAIVIIVSTSMLTMALVLFGRTRSLGQGRADRVMGRVSLAMLVACVATVAYGVWNVRAFFICGLCAS